MMRLSTAVASGLIMLAPQLASAKSLAGVCPNPVVFQTDWYPQAENALAFQMIGKDGKVDADRGTYTGPLADTGIDLEVRLGGPFVGYQAVTPLMYQDRSILLGLVSTDEAILNSAKFPTIAVMAPLDKSPQVIMFARADYPDLSKWSDVKATGAKVLYFEGSSFMTYLVGKGLVSAAQLDGSYDGSPSRFAAQPKLMQSGYVTNDVYRYEHTIKQIAKPMGYLMVSDAGYTVYTSAVAVRPDAVTQWTGCLAALVPMMQQAQVDYMASPQAANAALLSVNGQLRNPWVITAEVNDYGDRMMKQLGIVANGPGNVLGKFDVARIDAFLREAVPIFKDGGKVEIPQELTASKLVTNQFIDPAIGLPK